MKHKYLDQLLRHLEGTLTPSEQARITKELERSPALRSDLGDVDAISGLLRTAMAESDRESLKPFFADRLMRRLNPPADEALFGSLWNLFRPVAFASLLLIASLASYSATRYNAWDARPTTTEAILGLEPVTLTAAYTSDIDLFAPFDP